MAVNYSTPVIGSRLQDNVGGHTALGRLCMAYSGTQEPRFCSFLDRRMFRGACGFSRRPGAWKAGLFGRQGASEMGFSGRCRSALDENHSEEWMERFRLDRLNHPLPLRPEMHGSKVRPGRPARAGPYDNILFQGFNWESHGKYPWYKELGTKVNDMAVVGITDVWLPPPTQSVDKQDHLSSDWGSVCFRIGSGRLLKLCNPTLPNPSHKGILAVSKGKSTPLSPGTNSLVTHGCETGFLMWELQGEYVLWIAVCFFLRLKYNPSGPAY